MKATKKHIWWGAGFLLLGIIWRLLYLWQFSASPLFEHPGGPDVSEYDHWAREILGGQWLWPEVHIHAPLYSYYLALLYKITGFDYFWVRFLQLMVGLAGAIPVYLVLCRGKWRRPSLTARIFILIVLFYPPLIYYQAELICEALLLPLLGMAWYMIRRRWFLGAGCFTGLAVITHPGSLVFFVGEIILLAVSSAKLRGVLFYVVGALVFIAPIAGYNSYLEGRLVPVQLNGGMNIYIGNNIEADGTCNVRPGKTWDEMTRQAHEKAAAEGKSADRVYLESAAKFIYGNPLTFVRLSFRKFVLVWNWRELISGADAAPLRYFTPMQRYTAWSFMIVGVLGLSGLLCMTTHWRKLLGYRHLLWWLFSFWLLQTITVTSGRYRVAMLYPIFIFAALLISEFVRKNRFRPVWLTFTMLLAVAVVILPKAPHHSLDEQIEGITLLGKAYAEAGNQEQARRYMKYALEHDEDQLGITNLLASLYIDSDPAYAEGLLRRAIATDPTQGESYINMAIVKTVTGRYAEAEDYFKLAEKNYILNYDDFYYNRGFFRERTGDLRRAADDYLQAIKVNPGNRKALNAAGVVFFKMQDIGQAGLYFRKALALDPENTGIMLNMAAISAVSNDKVQAEQWVRKVLKIDPLNEKASLFMKMLEQ